MKCINCIFLKKEDDYCKFYKEFVDVKTCNNRIICFAKVDKESVKK